MRALTWRTLGFALTWWLLVEGTPGNLLIGIGSIGSAVAASLYLLPPSKFRFSALGLIAFAGFFIVQSVKASIQVAFMALRPRLDLDPALIKVPVTLPPGAPTVMLLNTLTLLPGTLSVHIENNELYLHVLDRTQPVLKAVRMTEARIAHMLKITP